MIIRDARPGDAGAIAIFWNPLIRDTAVTFTSEQKHPDQLAREIAEAQSAGRGCLVAELAGRVQGFARYAPFRSGPGYAHTMEHSIILAGDARGQGVGRALMAALETHAGQAGVHSMVAGISAENPGAVAFHASLGYLQIAILPEAGFKFGRWMDLVLMQKLL